MFNFRDRNSQKQQRGLKSYQEEKKDIAPATTKKGADPASLDSYKISEKSKKALIKRGIVTLFPVQQKTFNLVYNGVDVIARD